MKKTVIGIIAILSLTAAGLSYGYFSYFPKRAHQTVLATLQQLGIETQNFPPPEQKPGALLYKDIKLDTEGFSTIDNLVVEYSPLNLIGFGRLSSLHFYGLELTGEMTFSLPPTITIAGWTAKPLAETLAIIPANSIAMKDTKIALLTNVFGGISFHIDGQGRTNESGIEFQLYGESKQKNLNITANANGVLTDNYWNADVEIEQGKIKLPTEKFQATRVNGWANISYGPGNPLTIMSELRAGGVSLFGLPWQNAAATIELKDQTYKIFSEAKSIGTEGVELTLNAIRAQDGKEDINGSLYTTKLSNLLDYLSRVEALPFQRSKLKIFNNAQDMGLDFSMPGHSGATTRQINFTLKNIADDVHIKGNLLFENMDKYQGSLSSDPISIALAQHVFTGSKIFTNGDIFVSGDFVKTGDSDLKINLKSELKNIRIDALSPFVQKIGGLLQLYEETGFKPAENKNLSCEIPLLAQIEYKCMLDPLITPETSKIRALTASVFGGTAVIRDIDLNKPDNRYTIQLSNISLKKLLPSLNIEGLSGMGTISGILPITRKEGKIYIQNALITTPLPGKVKYKGALPATLNMDVVEKETIKMALENYHFDFFEIKMNGPLDGVTLSLIGKGKNPDLLNGRAIVIKLSEAIDFEAILGLSKERL